MANARSSVLSGETKAQVLRTGASGQRTVTSSDLRRPILAGFAVIALFFGGFLGWAALAPLESAAVAPGVVSVDTNRKTVQHLEGGIIRDILVRDSTQVRAGQVLIRLDDTQPRARLELLRGRHMTAIALKARLIAEREGHDHVNFPTWLANQRTETKPAEIIRAQLNIFEARRETLKGQVAIIEQRTAEYAEEIKGLKGQIAAEREQRRLIAEEIDVVRYLLEKGLVRKPRYLELRRRKAGIEGSLSRNAARIARAKQSIEEARLRISELWKSATTEVVQLLRQVQSELFDLDEQIRAAENVLDRTEIRAPNDGTIVGLRVHTPGGVITQGEPLMYIVPSGDRMVIEAQIDPNDIDVVRKGLPAQVHLTSFSRRNSMPLDGEVIWVSADRMADDRTGQYYYLARIELEQDPGDALNGASLLPGMPAEVMIVTGKRTVIDYLMSPVLRSLNRSFREE